MKRASLISRRACCVQVRGKGDTRRWEEMGEVGKWAPAVLDLWARPEIRRSKLGMLLKIFNQLA